MSKHPVICPYCLITLDSFESFEASGKLVDEHVLEKHGIDANMDRPGDFADTVKQPSQVKLLELSLVTHPTDHIPDWEHYGICKFCGLGRIEVLNADGTVSSPGEGG